MGIAEALVVKRADDLSSGGEGDMPAGEAMEFEKMNSSRFMGSDGGVLPWSMDCLNLAMPEGALGFCWDILCRRGRVQSAKSDTP